MRHHTQHLRVAFVDTDLSGRIHYTAAMRYFEAAEHALMRGVWAELEEDRPLLPRVHVEADFRVTLAWEDEIDCTARVVSVGRTSISFGYRVVRSRDEALAVEGKIVAVSIDEAGRPTPISDTVRQVLESNVPAGIP